MTQKKSNAQRLGRVLEKVTNQSSRVPTTPEYGSWILGRVSESQRRRRVRIQLILTTFVVIANLIGIGVAILVVTVTFPVPSVFDARVLVDHVHRRAGLHRLGARRRRHLGDGRVINNVRWAIEEREPTRADQRNTFFAPWRLTRVLLVLWGGGTVLSHHSSTGCRTPTTSRRCCSASAFPASSCRPAATCSPSSRCGRSPLRRSKSGRRRAASPLASWAAR